MLSQSRIFALAITGLVLLIALLAVTISPHPSGFLAVGVAACFLLMLIAGAGEDAPREISEARVDELIRRHNRMMGYSVRDEMRGRRE